MKDSATKTFLPLLICLLVSCVSSNEPYKPLTEDENSNFIVIGSLQVIFKADSQRGSGIMTEAIKHHAYIRLKEEALNNYPGNIDIRNIEVVYLQGHYTDQEWMASGDVIAPSSSTAKGIEGSLARAAGQIMSSLQSNAKIAIVYVSSNDSDITVFIADELEYIMVNEGFTIIDRSQLDKIRDEQNLQLSGEVDDDTAVSIGKIAGANIIITGSVTGADSTRRLRIRALSTQTAQVLAAASERF